LEVQQAVTGLLQRWCQSLDRARARGRLQHQPVPYLELGIDQFRYEQGHKSHSTSYSETVKDELSMVEMSQHYRQFASRSSAFRSARKVIGDFYSREEGAVQQDLYSLLLAVAKKHIEERARIDDVAAEFCIAIIRDLDESVVTWKLKAGVRGIWSDKSHALTDDFKIRPLEVSDLERQVPLSHLPFSSTMPSPELATDSVIEGKVNAKHQGRVTNSFDRMIDAISLFETGSVYSEYVSVSPASITRHGSSRYGGRARARRHKFGITNENASTCSRFLRHTISRVGELRKAKEQNHELHASLMAFNRYLEAVTMADSLEAVVARAVTSLEALLLSGERSELASRLGHRAALLVSNVGYEPTEVMSLVSRAYKVRSKYVHGSPLTKFEINSLKHISGEVLNLNRVALNLMLGLHEGNSKKQVLRKLDDALLDLGQRERIFQEIAADPIGALLIESSQRE
jgi:hypothetical protein